MIAAHYSCDKGHRWVTWWDEIVPRDERVDCCEECEEFMKAYAPLDSYCAVIEPGRGQRM